MKGKVVAVIPALNEEKHVSKVVDRSQEFLNQVIVVDDGSNDETRNRALDAGANVLFHTRNLGCGATLRTGFFHAYSLKPDIVVMLDADEQHNPEEIPSLVEPILRREAVLVVGERDFTKMSLGRRVSNLLSSKILCDWFNVGLHDTQCGFRAIRTDALKLMSLRQNGYPWASEMFIQAQQLEFKMKSVPVETIRPEHSSIKPLRDTFRFLAMILEKRGSGHVW